MPLIPFPIFHPRIRLPSCHRPHSPSITYTIIPSLNSNSTIHSFFLRYSIHHSPLSYLHSILRLSLFPFPFFLSIVVLIAMHLSHASLIHSISLSLSIPIPILQHCPHRCASLSSSSNLFFIIHTFISSRLSIFHSQSQLSLSQNHFYPRYLALTACVRRQTYKGIILPG